MNNQLTLKEFLSFCGTHCHICNAQFAIMLINTGDSGYPIVNNGSTLSFQINTTKVIIDIELGTSNSSFTSEVFDIQKDCWYFKLNCSKCNIAYYSNFIETVDQTIIVVSLYSSIIFVENYGITNYYNDKRMAIHHNHIFQTNINTNIDFKNMNKEQLLNKIHTYLLLS